MKEHQTFPTDYTQERNLDNSIDRIYPGGSREPELTQEYLRNRRAACEMQYLTDAANLDAQLEKLVAFELEVPPFDIPTPPEEHVPQSV